MARREMDLIVLETAKGKIGVINVQARTFMQPILDNPFHAVEAAVMKMRSETRNIIVDAHGETTSEKIALGRFLDGKVSAVIGTHTHVQTADEQIFPGGTAFLCDAGMCGPVNSILGRAIDPIMNRFVSNLPASFPVAGGEVRLRGALVEIDETTGRAVRIARVDEPGPSDAGDIRAGAKGGRRTSAIAGTDLKLLNLRPTIHLFRFELPKDINVQQKTMNKSSAFILIAALALCASQVCQAQAKKNPEANRLAREGAEAAKNQDWDKAVDLLRKATALDHKYGDELSAGLSTARICGCKRPEYRDADQRLQRSP